MSAQPPWPLIEIAIKPYSTVDQDTLDAALRELATADMTLRVFIDRDSGQTLLRGTDETHLSSTIDVLRRDYEIDATVAEPRVAYRETITRGAVIDYAHKVQSGGWGQFARVKLTFEPGAQGSGYTFENRAPDGAVPLRFAPGVEQGLTAARETGLLAGFPVIDFKAELTDGASHDLDSTLGAFEIAAQFAFRQLREKGAPILLEPIMSLRVATPDDCAAEVRGELKGRGVLIQSADQAGDTVVIMARTPLALMFGYRESLRALSAGRASFVMAYERYAPVGPLGPGPDLFPPATAMRA